MSTNNICFRGEISKIIFWIFLLTGAMCIATEKISFTYIIFLISR